MFWTSSCLKAGCHHESSSFCDPVLRPHTGSAWWLKRTILYPLMSFLPKEIRGSVHVMSHWSIFTKYLLLWKTVWYYIFWVYVYSPSYPACKAYAPYYHIILSCMAFLAVPCFVASSHKWNDFQEVCMKHKMCVFIFSATFVWNTSHSEKNSVRYDNKFTHISM